jgi:hypothetical protein
MEWSTLPQGERLPFRAVQKANHCVEYVPRGQPRLVVRPQQLLSLLTPYASPPYINTCNSPYQPLLLSQCEAILSFTFDLHVCLSRYRSFCQLYLVPDPLFPLIRPVRPEQRSLPQIHDWLLKPPKCRRNFAFSPWYAALPPSTCLDLATCCPSLLEFTRPT